MRVGGFIDYGDKVYVRTEDLKGMTWKEHEIRFTIYNKLLE